MKLEKVALFLQLIVGVASDTGTNGMVNTLTESPDTKSVHASVVNLTSDSFNKSVSKEEHFVMFFDST